MNAHGGTLRPMLLGSDSASARVALVSEGALLLAGDHVAIDIDVGEATRLEILELSGTVAYDMRGEAARWDVRIILQRGATLIWHCAPFVVSEGADVQRTTTVEIAETARLLLREQLVLGRSGERPGLVRSALRIRDHHRSLLAEDLDLGPHSTTGGLLGANRVIESVIAIGTGPVDMDVEARMVLEHNGTIWRRLSPAGHTASLSEVWRHVLGQVSNCS